MTHAGYIAAAWIITLGLCGLYAMYLIARGRSLTEQVPEDRRRWMTTPDEVQTDE